MERKEFTAELKVLNGEGTGLARIAMLGPPPDRDNDILEHGVLGTEQVVPVLVAHQWDRLPVGKATVREENGALLARFKLNMEMAAARTLHSALTFDLATPPSRMEWSFGYMVKDAQPDLHEGQRIRRLRRIELIEVSPVIKGAGRETTTLALKEGVMDQAALAASVKATLARAEQLQIKLLVADFQRITDREREARERPFKYVFVKRGERPEIERAAARFASWAAADLGISTPEVRLFKAARADEPAGFCMSCRAIGVHFNSLDGIAVDASLGAEELAQTIAHETAHANGADEREAEAFARKFLTTYREKAGARSAEVKSGRPMPGDHDYGPDHFGRDGMQRDAVLCREATTLAWEQTVAVAQYLRQQGIH